MHYIVLVEYESKPDIFYMNRTNRYINLCTLMTIIYLCKNVYIHLFNMHYSSDNHAIIVFISTMLSKYGKSHTHRSGQLSRTLPKCEFIYSFNQMDSALEFSPTHRRNSCINSTPSMRLIGCATVRRQEYSIVVSETRN